MAPNLLALGMRKEMDRILPRRIAFLSLSVSFRITEKSVRDTKRGSLDLVGKGLEEHSRIAPQMRNAHRTVARGAQNVNAGYVCPTQRGHTTRRSGCTDAKLQRLLREDGGSRLLSGCGRKRRAKSMGCEMVPRSDSARQETQRNILNGRERRELEIQYAARSGTSPHGYKAQTGRYTSRVRASTSRWFDGGSRVKVTMDDEKYIRVSIDINIRDAKPDFFQRQTSLGKVKNGYISSANYHYPIKKVKTAGHDGVRLCEEIIELKCQRGVKTNAPHCRKNTRGRHYSGADSKMETRSFGGFQELDRAQKAQRKLGKHRA
ncbi:hypothetical protein B0H12DRAFT_1072454 [Mycena haematopus]|nr:hypothetical protein B0H12DRAFT_1072454 [Mycena haematopus]